MAVPNAAPKKPANQGGKAAANVQPVNAFEASASNTNGMPHMYDPSTGNWQDHAQRTSPRGFGGSGKGAK